MDITEAFQELLPTGRTGNDTNDLAAAAKETWRRRHVNTEAGAAVIGALNGYPFLDRPANPARVALNAGEPGGAVRVCGMAALS